MSLIHWWSLDKDLKDNITLETVGGTYTKDSNGKIGNCLKNSYPGFQTSVKLVDEWNHWKHSVSMSCWVKINYDECNTYLKTLSYSSNATTPTGCLIGQTSYGGLGIYWYANNIYNGGNTANLSYINFAGYTRGSSSTAATTSYRVEFDKWYHMTLVADYRSKVLRFYVNGTQVGSDSSYSSIPEMTDVRYFGWGRGEVYGGNGPGGYLPMRINDIRLYDHALSQAEVKELSKALVVHYTFNDVLVEPTTNLLPTSMQSMTVNSAPGVYGNPATINITSGLTNGADYTLSLWQTVGSANQSTGVSTRLICYYTDGTYDDNSTSKMGITLPQDDKEYYYEITVITNKNKTISYLGGWILDHSSGNGKVRSYRNAQIEAKDHATPYTPTSREGILVNEAGYSSDINNCGFVLSKDAAKGSYSSYYKNGEQYLISKNTPLNNEIVSTSVWFKSTNTSPKTDYHILISVDVGVIEISIPKNGQLRWGGYTSNNSRVCNNVTVTSSSGSTFSLLDGKWHLINTIYDGSGWHAYVDGVYQTKWNATGTISYTNKNLIIGKFSEGATSNYGATDAYIDDVKIYNTILTSDDIKDLYQTKAYISDKGDIMCSEFIEGKNQAQVISKGVFEANEFYEDVLPLEYEQLEYIETDGNAYINTGYNTTNVYQIDCDMEITGEVKSNYWFGQQQKSGMLYNGFYGQHSLEFNWVSIKPTSQKHHTLTQRLVGDGTNIDITIDGVKYTVATGTNGQGGDFYIFACRNNNNELRVYGSKLRLYSFRIHENNFDKRNFLPAKRKSDNVIGLFDIITQTFYTNAGSGAFSGGGIITNRNASIYDNQNVSGRNLIEI